MEWIAFAFAAALGGLGTGEGRFSGDDLPSKIPLAPADIVVVKSCCIPMSFPGYMHFAHHSWIDVKRGSEDRWFRVEVAEVERGGVAYPIAASYARSDIRWENRPVRVLGILSGKGAEKAVDHVVRTAIARGPAYKTIYKPLPGPNSNTFIRELTRGISRLSFYFHHNAVGKDYASTLVLLRAPSGTGWTITCPYGGLTIAVREGVQLHFLGFTLGSYGLPPKIEVPFLP